MNRLMSISSSVFRKMAGQPNFFQRWIWLGRFRMLGLPILIAAFLGGCTGHIIPESRDSATVNDVPFIVVMTTPNDTPAGLAETYLGDSRRAWQILEFNRIKALKSRRRVVIPLQPINPGGLTTEGYQSVPVLAYADAGTGAPADGGRLTASQLTSFEDQMRFLNENEFTTASLAQFHNFLQFQDSLPPKTVVLAFHTEVRWFYEQVWPILQAYGFTAALFITPAAIGRSSAMGWQEIEALVADGIEIGIRDSQIDEGENPDRRRQKIENALIDAKDRLSKQLAQPCAYFSYSLESHADDWTTALLKKYGFHLALTTETGTNPFFSDAFKLRQSRVDFGMNVAEFKTHAVVFQRMGTK